LRYIAAVIDEQGEERAARLLAHEPKPADDQIHAALVAVDGRGFTSKFPHLLLGAKYWLPFAHDMIIEEPN
jgi:hypothetical protein